mmetsp:Transcript_18128/g.39028  ORF Transcript_18128/g.39028 Transcript_18128/m.39028 type:complete len:109 (-) Transcript_18128:784-1110(-)
MTLQCLVRSPTSGPDVPPRVLYRSGWGCPVSFPANEPEVIPAAPPPCSRDATGTLTDAESTAVGVSGAELPPPSSPALLGPLSSDMYAPGLLPDRGELHEDSTPCCAG